MRSGYRYTHDRNHQFTRYPWRISSPLRPTLDPIWEVWIHDEAFAASRLSMMRIMAMRTKDEGGDGHSVTLEVASQAAIATDPGERPFDDPPFGQDLEARNVGSLHDLQLPCSCSPDSERHLVSGIATISKDAFDKREQSPCPAQQQQGAVTVLNIGGMNHNVQKEAQRVDQDVPLA